MLCAVYMLWLLAMHEAMKTKYARELLPLILLFYLHRAAKAVFSVKVKEFNLTSLT